KWVRPIAQALGKIKFAGPFLEWALEGVASAGELMRGEGDSAFAKFAARFWELVGDGLRAGISKFQSMLSEIMVDSFGKKNAYDIAVDFLEGLKEGFLYQFPRIKDAVTEFAHDVLEIFKYVWKMQSPSQAMRDVGDDFMLGFENGLKERRDGSL